MIRVIYLIEWIITLTPVSWYGAGSNPLPEGEGACWLVLHTWLYTFTYPCQSIKGLKG